MLAYFITQKQRINQVLQTFLDRKNRELEKCIPWGRDVIERIKPFAANGKMIRGGLVVLAHDMFTGAPGAAALQAGAAMELFQSAFLIHDDIMDQDDLRRGEKTIFQQYLELGQRQRLPAADRFGDAMATCAGDIAFFLAFELLNQLPVNGEIRQTVTMVTLRENAKVGLGQMQDVYFGFLREPVAEEEIINVFRNKTATYTFILPLLVGSLLAGRQENELTELRDFGETMGIMFQMRDDDLGMFGNEVDIGKPVGSDIRQGKKTLFHLYLMNESEESERHRLMQLFHNPEITADDVLWVRGLIIKYGIRERLQRRMEEMAMLARRQLAKMSLPLGQYGEVLREIIEYSLSRAK